MVAGSGLVIRLLCTMADSLDLCTSVTCTPLFLQQVYLGPSLELGQILFAGKVCVTFSESICIWVYHGSNAPTQ